MLTCIQCSGVHRELGVRFSRIQSLTLDLLGPSELLVRVKRCQRGFGVWFDQEAGLGRVALPELVGLRGLAEVRQDPDPTEKETFGAGSLGAQSSRGRCPNHLVSLSCDSSWP